MGSRAFLGRATDCDDRLGGYLHHYISGGAVSPMYMPYVVSAAVNDEFGYRGEEAAVIMLGAQPMSVGAIAAAIDRSPSATVRLTDRLVTDGHVSRKPSALDARVVVASLTPVGEARRLRALSARDRVLRDATRTLDDADRAVLAGILQTMLSGLVATPTESYRICRLCDEDSCVPRGCPVEERYEQLTGV